MSLPIPPSDASPLPSRPRLVFRLGFAGRRELSESEQTLLATALDAILGRLGKRLAEIAPGTRSQQGPHQPVAAFYSQDCPVLRLVTGLCEGADTIAAAAVERISAGVTASGGRCLETELAAVLPFDVESYRSSRQAGFRAEFDAQLARCAWVLALDGIYEKPEPDTRRAGNRRARAYRAQSAFLLRQSDILIAAANPDDSGKAGGTLETVQQALVFDLPVIFIHTGKTHPEEAVYLIEPGDSLHNVVAGAAPATDDCVRRLEAWVTQLTADPDNGLGAGPAHESDAGTKGLALLGEYFDTTNSPHTGEGSMLVRVRKGAWQWFEGKFKKGKSLSDPKLAPYDRYRDRATQLNYHYTGLYRGAFLLNYALAIVAVILAAVSLTLIGTSAHTPLGREIVSVLTNTGHLAAESTLSTSTPRPWLLPVLLTLAAAKLAILIFISRNTRTANRQFWNDRAVDTRYLAERLRGMYYLALSGSHQPPVAAPPQFASRVVRQSTVDWLFDAIVRSISPASLDSAKSVSIPAHDGRGTVTIQKLLTLNPADAMHRVRETWIAGQTTYHENNSRTMHGIHHWLEAAQKRLGWVVIGVVAFDLLLIGGKVMHWLPESLIPFAKAATPWLIAISAILPAIVAALSGIRFQSECQRLAERSGVMRTILSGRPDNPGGRAKQAGTLADLLAREVANPDTDPGSWSHEVMRFTERVATDFVQEAAEWSVLYAKEVSEPG